MERVVLLLAAGWMGALLARRFRMPGGSLLGAMLAAAAVNLTVADMPSLPAEVRTLAIVLLGAYTGSSMDRRSFVRLRSVIPWHAVAVAALIAVGLGLGLALRAWAPEALSLVTAVLSTTPGGASGLTAVAYDLGADARLVASLHSVRLFVVFGVLPLMMQWALRMRRQAGDGGAARGARNS